MGEILGDMSGGVRKYGSEWKEMMCRSFIKGNEVPDTSSVGSIDAETVALARSIK